MKLHHLVMLMVHNNRLQPRRFDPPARVCPECHVSLKGLALWRRFYLSQWHWTWF